MYEHRQLEVFIAGGGRRDCDFGEGSDRGAEGGRVGRRGDRTAAAGLTADGAGELQHDQSGLRVPGRQLFVITRCNFIPLSCLIVHCQRGRPRPATAGEGDRSHICRARVVVAGSQGDNEAAFGDQDASWQVSSNYYEL